ncbi:serine protease Do [Brevundimonas lenta]|uniref:Serine protease Do n=2 Tax=Brevundimonas lenta TaxID=424796 RepID=A0A7W6NP54_9CAUL|nr:serine protease Do [Brevundimonas lenta]
MKRKEFMLGAVAGLAFAAAATAGGVIDWPSANAGPVAGVSGRLAPNAGGNGLAFAPPQGAPLSFADIFQQVAPAVVQIDVKTRVPAQRGIQIPGLPPGLVPPEEEAAPDDEGATALGAGSGFFISADGYIVTNNHVVADATEITVRLADERELTARVVGRDENTDLAVIKVEGDNFPFVTFEETAQPRVGDWVIAVGNPFGLGGTATAGIVSAQGRGIDSAYVDYLQIDAAINRGNSGGPTFDIYGRVIGVNSAIFSPTGNSVGIGFAIPASVAKPITDRLMRGEAIQRGYIGAGLRSLSPEAWEALGLPRDFKGANVESVTPGGPAARAGLQVGDMVVGVNGRPVSDSTEITRMVGAVSPGDTIRLDILRDGRRQTLNVRSGTRPSEAELREGDDQGGAPAAPGTPPAAQGEPVEGVSVAPLTPALRSRFDVPETVEGVIITSVTPRTPAARLGLEAGFVITRANNRPVASAADLRNAVAEVKRAGRPGVLLFVWTSQGAAPVVLRFAEGD